MELSDLILDLKTNVDSVQSSMKAAQEQLAKTKAEHDEWDRRLAVRKQQHAALVGELEAKKVAADRAAEENARRIKLNNDQVAELERIRTELEKREKNVVFLEQRANAKADEYIAKAQALAKRESEVARKEAEINQRWSKMKEAIA